MSSSYSRVNSFSGTFVLGAGCILPFFAQALPRPVTNGHQSNANDDSGGADVSLGPSSTTRSSSLAVIAPWDSHGKVTSDPRTIIQSLLLFILFALLALAIYWFGPSLRRRLLKTLGREPAAGPGFGFDGLSKAQLKAVRLKEMDEGRNGEWFIKLPAKPPKIALREFPLPPIQIPADILNKSER